MSIEIIPTNDIKKLDRQITALKAIISKDNFKDRNSHIKALEKLREHRTQRVKGIDNNG